MEGIGEKGGKKDMGLKGRDMRGRKWGEKVDLKNVG